MKDGKLMKSGKPVEVLGYNTCDRTNCHATSWK